MVDVEQGQTRTPPAEAGQAADPLPATRRPSEWRWPGEPGKLPEYIKAQFRMKTFGLIAIQCAIVFGISALVDFALTATQWRGHTPKAICIGLGLVNVLVLYVLHSVKRRFPTNYITLAFFTLIIGASWGIGGSAFATHAHFQLLAIIFLGMGVAAAFQTLAMHVALDGCLAFAAPLLAGWLAGSVAVVVSTQRLGEDTVCSLVAASISFVQFVWLMVDMNGTLRKCNPDDFMKVIVSLDSTLLVIVSIPLFVVATCVLHSSVDPDRSALDADERTRAGQERGPA